MEIHWQGVFRYMAYISLGSAVLIAAVYGFLSLAGHEIGESIHSDKELPRALSRAMQPALDLVCPESALPLRHQTVTIYSSDSGIVLVPAGDSGPSAPAASE